MLENSKRGVEKKTKDGNEYWWQKYHLAVKVQLVLHNPEDHGMRTSTSSSSGGSTKPTIEGDRNKNKTITKELKDELLSIK